MVRHDSTELRNALAELLVRSGQEFSVDELSEQILQNGFSHFAPADVSSQAFELVLRRAAVLSTSLKFRAGEPSL